jgi:radical SAM protein with 4Fe4S-binding SPASM domain
MSKVPVTVKFVDKQQFLNASNTRGSTRTPDGMLVRTQALDTPKGPKTNKLVSVIPHANEDVKLLSANKHRFEDLKHVNLILTNTCNLSCSYCYEQHQRDYGRFTVDSLKQIYMFLANVNDSDGKLLQFFGGEPLIHKNLILDFLRTHEDDLTANMQDVRISMITNGTLLTEEFIKEYFSYPFTSMSISLDTDDAENDHREVTQEQVDHIINLVSHIPANPKNERHVSIRCTISRETAPRLKAFCERLYTAGIRAMVIHPLTMSAADGNLLWTPEEWHRLQIDIQGLVRNLDNFEIHFSEGVGGKKAGNCMVGSDMIAVDASGDFAGCYFFTNQKAALQHTILGNIFDNSIYTSRYESFQKSYDALFEHEQCKACDLKGFCYQCPAGNLHTGDKQMFRPDSMCQQIVSLFITLQNDLSAKMFKTKYDNIREAIQATHPSDDVSKKMVCHLMVRNITGKHTTQEDILQVLDILPSSDVLLGYFQQLIERDVQELTPGDLVDLIPTMLVTPINIRDFYVWYIERQGIPSERARSDALPMDLDRTAFYYTLLHMVMLNPKGDALTAPKKIVHL